MKEILEKPCEEFEGAKTSAGYGSVWHNGIWIAKHRLEWEEKRGIIPVGMNVLHRCDNPPCYEVTHLYLGTHQDNIQDIFIKDRSSVASLTYSEVQLIKEELDKESYYGQLRDIAKRYGVHWKTVSRIKHKKTWRF